MIYKVTLSYTADVEAGSESEAEERAEESLERLLADRTPLEFMETHYGDSRIYFPDNNHGIEEGYYDLDGLVRLLRNYQADQKAIQFIADMLEQ